MAHDVFISYSSNNNQIAQAVCHALEEAKIRCWIAPRNIRPGADYADCIDSAIHSCKVFILIFSESAQLSKWVKSELNIAFDSNKTIIPFRIDPTSLHGAMRLILNDKHWLDAFPEPSKKFAELTNIVSNILSSPDSFTPESVSSATTQIKQKDNTNDFRTLLLKKLFPSIYANTIRIRSNRPTKIYINGTNKGVIKDESTHHFKINDEYYSIEAFSIEHGDKAVLRFEGTFDNNSMLINIDMRQCELKYLSSLNDSGHINSIGLTYYEEGKYEEAYPYFVRAAHMGEAAALYNLGLLYHWGKGVAKDYEAAKDYYEQACEQKYPLAYHNLGSLYYNGTYVKQDYAKAFELFMKAAERGIESAQFTVASMLYHGEGVKVDKPAAKKWFEKAAAQGSSEAQKYLDSWMN